MARIRLEAAVDAVERLTHDRQPLKAVLELAWNGFDADAAAVQVELERDDLEAVVEVRVLDDGHGMSPEAADSAFAKIGGSWKPGAKFSPGKRSLHGRSGEGRLRAFALGAEVAWETTAEDVAGQRKQTVIQARRDTRNDFDVESRPAEQGNATGTRFSARGLQSNALNQLLPGKALPLVAAEFAPFLLANPSASLTYDGVVVSPADFIADEASYGLTFVFDGNSLEAGLRVIEWKSGTLRTIQLCDETGIPVEEMPASVAADFAFTAYVTWEGMQQHRADWIMADWDGSPLAPLLRAAREQITAHFDARRDTQRKQVVREWKERQTYPYASAPTNSTEQAEQTTFDIVATAIHRHLPGDQRKQRLALALLKTAMQHSPDGIVRVLDEIVSLPSDERNRLDALLERTTLPNIIQASTSVTDRLDFLAALDHMVFDPKASKLIGEREHLHRILERELWIFGEQYNMMLSERGLTAVLERHMHILGRTPADGSVTRPDGSQGRVDLMLSARATEHDRARHLVVELKAPRVKGTEKEIRQIKSYASTVIADARFAQSDTDWDFWLIISDLDEEAVQEANQRDRPRGLISEPRVPNREHSQVRVWLRTWSEILEDNHRRLQFYKDQLSHNPTLEHALDYLERQHSDLLPDDWDKSRGHNAEPSA